MRQIDPRKQAGVRVFLLVAVLWTAGIMTLQYVQAAQNNAGGGFGDGRLQPSLNTPGGPYYPDGYDRN